MNLQNVSANLLKLSFHLRAMALSMNGIEIRKSDNKSTLIVSFFQKIKAYYFMKVGLVDLSTLGGKIKFEFCRPALRCLDMTARIKI